LAALLLSSNILLLPTLQSEIRDLPHFRERSLSSSRRIIRRRTAVLALFRQHLKVTPRFLDKVFLWVLRQGHPNPPGRFSIGKRELRRTYSHSCILRGVRISTLSTRVGP
jgi:hypothetical protein